MAKNSKSFLVQKVNQDIETKFGTPDSPYQIALEKRKDKKYPIEGPWINGGVIKFLERTLFPGPLAPQAQPPWHSGNVGCLPYVHSPYTHFVIPTVAKELSCKS